MKDLFTVLSDHNTWEYIKQGWELIQVLLVIGVTLFTAEWTYKTFGHKEKVEVLKALLKSLRGHQYATNSYSALLDHKKETIKRTPDNNQMIGAVDRLMALDIQKMYKFQVDIQEALDEALELNQVFKTKFSSTAAPLFDSFLEPMPKTERDLIYNALRKQVETHSSLS